MPGLDPTNVPLAFALRYSTESAGFAFGEPPEGVA
jgi:hypothetical protein